MLTQSEVVRVLRKEYEPWVESLSDEEYRAIRKYSYNSLDKGKNRFFERLNAMLRGEYNREDVRKLLEYANIISRAIGRHPLEHDILCYRGMDVDPTANLVLGSEIRLKQFFSTSVIRSRALERAYMLVIKVPAGARGAYIEKISAFPSQREFLLDRYCSCRIVSRKRNLVKMEVICDD